MGSRLQDLRARVRAWPPLRLDAALAAALLLEALVEALFADAPLGARLAILGPAALVAAGVLVRRRAPVTAVGLAVAGLACTDLLVAAVENRLEGVWFAWLFLTYVMAARTEGLRLAAGTALAAGGVLLLVAIGPSDVPELVFALLLFVAAPVAAGRLLRARTRLGQALEDKAAQLERERRTRAEDAAAEERARIAGELHDVVAHALGAMTIQAAAARRLSATDTERASGAFEAIERTGRDALGELRTLLEILRESDEDEERALAPQPSMAFLGELVERFRCAGLPVDLEVDGGRPDGLSTGVDLTAYRVVQEALAAALEPGGAGHARVAVRYDDHQLLIEVTDDGVRDHARSLLGMRERVRLYGGEVEAGPRRSGGHAVSARLPLEGVAA